MDIRLVICSCPDHALAHQLALTLVEERLAACVNIIPGVSAVYRWQNQVEQATEVLLLIKTEASRVPALSDRIQTLHPYELPEILAIEVAGGLPSYLAWVAGQTREDP